MFLWINKNLLRIIIKYSSLTSSLLQGYTVFSQGFLTGRPEQTVHPDEITQNVASDQGLHSLPSYGHFIEASQGTKMDLFTV